jgi:hypothetical protein
MRGERVVRNGFVRGGQAERIDAVITREPKTVEQVAKDSGESVPRVKSHCTYWMRAELFYDMTDDGKVYRLAIGDPPGTPCYSAARNP